MTILAGTKAVASDVNGEIGINKYGRRDTTSANVTSSTAVGVLRLDNISVIGGRSYIINVSCHVNSTVTSDTIRVDVLGSTSGNATTSSPVVTSGQLYVVTSAGPRTWRFVYPAGATATLSLLLCIARYSGTGNCTLYADGVRNTELWIENAGAATDTGVDV